jgi:hypothetical protein
MTIADAVATLTTLGVLPVIAVVATAGVAAYLYARFRH